jgi:hypothetical protein
VVTLSPSPPLSDMSPTPSDSNALNLLRQRVVSHLFCVFIDLVPISPPYSQINTRFDDWQDEIQTLLDEVEQKSGLSLLHTTLFY